MADTKNKATNSSKGFFSKIKKSLLGLKPYFKHFWIFLYIVVFIGLSQVTLRDKASLGVYFNGLAIAALAGLALAYKPARRLAISATILPLATMISLVIPNVSNFAQTVIFYDSILVLGLIYRYMFMLETPAENSKIKPRNYLIFIPLMAVVGQILGVIGYAMLRYHYPFYGVSLPLVAATTVVFAFTEETFFRGLIQQRGNQVLHPYISGLLALLLFVSATISHTTLLMPLFAVILGLVLTITYYLKNNLLLTGTINFVTKLTYVGLMAAFIFR